MPYFTSREEIEVVVGGFFKRLPTIDPLVRAVLMGDDSLLKIELKNPELVLALNFAKEPLEVSIGSDVFGTIGLSAEADVFHELLLGLFGIAQAISHRKLLVRGALARLMQSTALVALAPYQYPHYLNLIGREDLNIRKEGDPSGIRLRSEGLLTRWVLKIMYLVGCVMGIWYTWVRSHLDIFKLLQRRGPLLIRIIQFLRRLGISNLDMVMVLTALGKGMIRCKRRDR